MIGPLIVSQVSDLLVSSRVQGDVQFVSEGFDLYGIFGDVLDMVQVRTWLYPQSQVQILGTDFYILSYQDGALLIFSPPYGTLDDILGSLLARDWSPAITSIPSMVVNPDLVPELRKHFPGLRTINIQRSDHNLLLLQNQNPGINFHLV